MDKKKRPFLTRIKRNKKNRRKTFLLLSVATTIVFGLIFFVLLYLQLKTSLEDPPSLTSGFFPVTREPVSLMLNLSSPENNLLVFDPNLLIQGTSSPNSMIIITTSKEDFSLEPDNQGYFSYTLELEQGLNEFSITAFDVLGNSKSSERVVYYSKEKI
ncbi:MAG: hypothetical protein C4584_01470 [Armatimonadetes bacterium]|nr:MAG: hypothetical protein C4584_01470 [Armatimonadota bacterium]